MPKTGTRPFRQSDRFMPDIVLLNVAAPVRGDHTVLAAIKNDPDLRDIPTMVLMARQIAEPDAKWLQAWSDDFLEKPFDVSDFLSKLQRLVRLAKDQNIVMLTPPETKSAGQSIRCYLPHSHKPNS